MKIRVYFIGLALALTGIFATSCGGKLKTGDDISKQDKDFIKGLGILDNNEKIILFDTQGGGLNGLKTSGNFFTHKRIASYWIDDRDTSNTSIEYAFYADIDTIKRYPKYKSLTLASYLEVYTRNGAKFKVYVSADSTRTWEFFNKAIEQWSKKTYVNKD